MTEVDVVTRERLLAAQGAVWDWGKDGDAGMTRYMVYDITYPSSTLLRIIPV